MVRPLGVKRSCFVENIDVLTLCAISKGFGMSVTCFRVCILCIGSLCSKESFDSCGLGAQPGFPHFKKKVSFPKSLDYTSFKKNEILIISK